MSEFGPSQPEKYPRIEIGKPLPGLRRADELGEGANYEDQVIPTARGNLHFFPVQLRGGVTIWAVEADENTVDTVFWVTVESGSGVVLSMNEGYEDQS